MATMQSPLSQARFGALPQLGVPELPTFKPATLSKKEASLLCGPSRDVFFAGSSKRSEDAPDAVELKTGKKISFQKAQEIMMQLSQMPGFMARTAQGMFPLGMDTLLHLATKVNNPSDPKAEMCEASNQLAEQLDWLDENREVDADVMSMVEAALEARKFTPADLTPETAGEYMLVPTGEDELTGFKFNDPFKVSAADRNSSLENAVPKSLETIKLAQKLIAEHGDRGFNAVNKLNTLGIRDAALLEAFTVFNSDPAQLIEAVEENNLLLIQIADNHKPKATRRLNRLG